MYQASAIFEGGGMRGCYSTGVIDAFLDHDIEFSSIYAVSAGACHATSYIAKQRGRAFNLCTKYLHDKEYCSLYSLITTGNLFGRDMMFRRFQEELEPFDFDTFAAYQGKFYAVVTDMATGCPAYLQLKPDSPKNRFPEICASASMPLLAKIVPYEGHEYLDGFVGDSIPIRKSIADGNPKHVLILTRPEGYRKGFEISLPFIWMKYHRYHAYVKACFLRAKRYNETLDFIHQEEEKGNVFVIRPQTALPVGMVTKNRKKLQNLYDLGYQDTEARIDDLLAYLNGS